MKSQIIFNKFRDDDGTNPRAMIVIEGYRAQVAAHIHVPLSAIGKIEAAAQKLLDMPFDDGETMARVVVEVDDGK